jgi:hypothetical protein
VLESLWLNRLGYHERAQLNFGSTSDKSPAEKKAKARRTMQANHLETFRVGSTAYLGELVTLGTKSSSTQMQTVAFSLTPHLAISPSVIKLTQYLTIPISTVSYEKKRKIQDKVSGEGGEATTPDH